MNLPLNLDQIGLLVAAFLTLCIFSYLLGDNFLYRLAVAILVGGGAAFICAVAVGNIILPRMMAFIRMLSNPGTDPVSGAFAMIGILLGLMILFKLSPRWAWLGNYSMAYLIGVGAGVAIGGAALGTLFAQSQATATAQGRMIPFIDPLIMLGVTLTVFISFTFMVGYRRGLGGLYTRLVQLSTLVGRPFLSIAFGVIFATIYIASVSVLISRVQFLIEAIKQLSNLSGLAF